VGIGDLALFSRQLQTLLEAGIPLTRGLYTLSNQVANRGFSEVLSEIAQHVDSGMSFSDALSNHSGVFPSLFVNMIRSGEASGNLDEILKQLAEQMEREKALRDNIKSATIYPIVVLCFALLVVLGMLLGVVPIFMKFFPPDMGVATANQDHHWHFQFSSSLLVFIYYCYYRYRLRCPLLLADPVRQPQLG
jgi:type IV pilus assembly protein PilC